MAHDMLYGYNTHYLQAYSQYNAPTSSYSMAQYSQAYPTSPRPNPATPSYHLMSSWYQSGPNRCTQSGCQFSGSLKSLETHMMDRHLIFPPGWDKKKKDPGWDADPSLKGSRKPIPIQGTAMVLDTKEATDAWIAERKKRFPTKARVEDKKRKMDEAIARGQLDFSERGMTKRRRVDESRRLNEDRNRNQRQQQSLPPRPRHSDTGWSKNKGKGLSIAVSSIPTEVLSESDSDDDDNEAPTAISSKEAPILVIDKSDTLDTADAPQQPSMRIRHTNNSNCTLQPKRQPRNPFASRPTLLRNLLLPEIKVTVSNLSQAIRFLVDNDFLAGVELRPGGALANKIEVLHQTGTVEIVDEKL